jgi:hypothetical protein
MKTNDILTNFNFDEKKIKPTVKTLSIDQFPTILDLFNIR